VVPKVLLSGNKECAVPLQLDPLRFNERHPLHRAVVTLEAGGRLLFAMSRKESMRVSLLSRWPLLTPRAWRAAKGERYRGVPRPPGCRVQGQGGCEGSRHSPYMHGEGKGAGAARAHESGLASSMQVERVYATVQRVCLIIQASACSSRTKHARRTAHRENA
jgi:hypothetical protein